jgi:ketosteroid isomerase-like protein
MELNADRLRELGQRFADAFAVGDVDAIVDLYAHDAVFISPNPPTLSPLFTDWVQGRDALRACLEAVFAPLPAGTGFDTLEVLTGVDSAVVIWKMGGRIGVDTLLYDSDGLIATHFDTAPQKSALA